MGVGGGSTLQGFRVGTVLKGGVCHLSLGLVSENPGWEENESLNIGRSGCPEAFQKQEHCPELALREQLRPSPTVLV